VLVRVDDNMPGPLGSLLRQGLTDGQGRTAIGQSDLNHDPSPFFDQEVTEDVTVPMGE
jgi:hypothetical protein